MTKDDWLTAFKGLLAIPFGFGVYILYVHVISLLDPVLTIVIGGLGLIAVGIFLFRFVAGVKYFIMSIFKDNKEVDEKGFKKHF